MIIFPETQPLGSVFRRQQNRGHRTIRLRDNPNRFVGSGFVRAQDSRSLPNRFVVQAFVAGANRAPIAADVVADEGGGTLSATLQRRDCAGRGDQLTEGEQRRSTGL